MASFEPHLYDSLAMPPPVCPVHATKMSPIVGGDEPLKLIQPVAERVNPAEDSDDSDDDDVSTEPTDTTDEEFFETVKPKVLQICATKFACRAPSRILIEHIKGGSYNHVVSVNIQPSETRKYTFKWLCEWFRNFCGAGVVKEEPEKYIVRIPRYELLGYGMKYDIDVLQFARERLSSPVARLLSFDPSTANALNEPYMIQERLWGQNLDDVITKLNLAQLKSLMKQVVRVHCDMRDITSTSAGVVRPSNADTETHLDKFMVPPRSKIHSSKPPTGPASPQTTLDFLLEQCTRFEDYEIETDGWAMPVWDDFRKIAQALHDLDLIKDDEVFYLCHMDLMARNILIDIIDSSTVTITGLLDWDADYACFCPKFTAFRAPFWLWLPADGNDDDETLAAVEPIDKANRELKKLFDEVASPEWKRYAFDPEYVLARRMFKILKNGMFSNSLYEEAQAVISEWNLLHPTQNLSQSMEVEHGSDESSSSESDTLSDSDSDSSDGVVDMEEVELVNECI